MYMYVTKSTIKDATLLIENENTAKSALVCILLILKKEQIVDTRFRS